MHERKTCRAVDGVQIVYSVAGTEQPALVFIHGGLANRSFWDAELKAFSARYRVIALDLPGHGDSGVERQMWGIPQFGGDVRAVIEAERINHAILFGNSLGGPVAIEAALLIPEKIIAVVGVDTFQSLNYKVDPEEMQQRANAFRTNYSAALSRMVNALFHGDADPALVADTERRMSGTPPEAAYRIFLSMAGYDPSLAARRLRAPLRAINGDLYPTDVEGVRKLKSDFDVVVMKHMGHYPMLERAAEFDHLVAEMITKLLSQQESRH
ncbi:MAG TPA: alpha/beta hydrolase [Candidatus Bathyarchaeia archaeon]|nr:alpha/beta hydrolase [Candidatus Bathyarchaeia archaeon]